MTLLSRMLPEWLRSEAAQGVHLLQLCKTQQLRINRALPAGQLRAKLKAAAESAAAEATAEAGGAAGAVCAADAGASAKHAAGRKPLVTAGFEMLGASGVGSAGVSRAALALLE